MEHGEYRQLEKSTKKSVRRFTHWFAQKYDSLDNRVLYALDSLGGRISSSDFVLQVASRANEAERKHKANAIQVWLEKSFARLMSTEFMASLGNEVSNAVDRKIEKRNEWARSHNKREISWEDLI